MEAEGLSERCCLLRKGEVSPLRQDAVLNRAVEAEGDGQIEVLFSGKPNTRNPRGIRSVVVKVGILHREKVLHSPRRIDPPLQPCGPCQAAVKLSCVGGESLRPGDHIVLAANVPKYVEHHSGNAAATCCHGSIASQSFAFPDSTLAELQHLPLRTPCSSGRRNQRKCPSSSLERPDGTTAERRRRRPVAQGGGGAPKRYDDFDDDDDDDYDFDDGMSEEDDFDGGLRRTRKILATTTSNRTMSSCRRPHRRARAAQGRWRRRMPPPAA